MYSKKIKNEVKMEIYTHVSPFIAKYRGSENVKNQH